MDGEPRNGGAQQGRPQFTLQALATLDHRRDEPASFAVSNDKGHLLLQRLSINAVTSAGRQGVIDAIAAALGELGGWIDDVHFFSNISVAIRSVLPADRVRPFGERLAALGLKLSDSAQRDLAASAAAPGSAAELFCTVQITFFHDEPDLRRHVPSVPG